MTFEFVYDPEFIHNKHINVIKHTFYQIACKCYGTKIMYLPKAARLI